MKALLALAILSAPASAAEGDRAEPYRILEQANLVRDPTLAASAYAFHTRLIFDYPGQPAETLQGHDAIRASYVRTFRQVDPGKPIRIRFRFAPPGPASDRQDGAYRIDAEAGGREITVYGRFSVKLVQEQGRWRFAEDRGGPASAADFEKLPE